jgi:hypothetical protein
MCGAMTLGSMTLCRMTVSMTHGIIENYIDLVLCCRIKYTDILNSIHVNVAQLNGIHKLLILNVILFNVVLLNMILLNVILVKANLLNVIVLNVLLLNVSLLKATL